MAIGPQDPSMMPASSGPPPDGMTPPSLPVTAPPGVPGQPQETGIQRNPPDIPDSRRNAVSKLVQEINLDKAHWKSDFDQMRGDMNFARGWQWPDQTGWVDERYIANLVQRHINQRVSALYAKNPTFVCRRKKRRDFKMWDGTPQQLQQASQAMQAPQMVDQAAQGNPVAAQAAMPQAMQAVNMAQGLMADVQQGLNKRKMYQNVAETLEIVFDYYVGEQAISFKSEMKQMVRRAITAGVAFVKEGFQRDLEKRPEVVTGIADASERMAHLKRLAADVADGQVDENSAEMEELRKTMEALQAEPDIMVREGLIFDYPQSWAIIPDRKCKQLKGFIGCDRVTQEYLLTPDQVKEIYNVDIGSSYTSYKHGTVSPTKLEAMGSSGTNAPDGQSYCCVWEVYDAPSATVQTVCEGWPDYLRAPAPPNPWMERFWPWFTLSFNDGEHPTKVYPVSDVFLLRPLQQEYNRCREGLRRHRIANRPKTIVAGGMLDEEDETSLKEHPDNAIIELHAIQPGQKVDDLLQPWKGPPIDPALYNVDAIFQDILRVVGSQEANLGGASGDTTATESSIAESSRLSSLQSNIDDLDDFLSELGRAGGQILLLNVSPETAKKVAGDGAVWPNASKQDVAEELYLEVQAGSSGRPNKAQEMQNLNMVLPYLLQIPGVNPQWLAGEVLRRLDDRLDLSDATAENIPSIVAMNSAPQPQSAAAPRPEGGPPAEGAAGAANAPQPAPGAQANAAPPAIPRTRPAVVMPPNVAARA